MEAEQPSAAGATSDAVGASYEDGASSAGPPCSTIAHGALSHVWPTGAITPAAIAMGVPTFGGAHSACDAEKNSPSRSVPPKPQPRLTRSSAAVRHMQPNFCTPRVVIVSSLRSFLHAPLTPTPFGGALVALSKKSTIAAPELS